MYKRAHFDIGQSSGGGVSGYFQVPANETYTVNIGFTPKYICVIRESANTVASVSVYNDDRTSQKCIATALSGSERFEVYNLPNITGYDRIAEIIDGGFKVRGAMPGGSVGSYRYFAMP